jgi:non-lysosomal glucosylceramidase
MFPGEYYEYDASNSSHHDSIMSDMLCGHWFLKASGIPDDEVRRFFSNFSVFFLE